MQQELSKNLSSSPPPYPRILRPPSRPYTPQIPDVRSLGLISETITDEGAIFAAKLGAGFYSEVQRFEA